MMSKTKLRKQRHEKKMAQAIELKRKKQFAKKYGLTIDANGYYVNEKPKEEFRPYVPPKTFHRETPKIASLKTSDIVPTFAAKKEPKQYTGTLIKGIATMHKSNAVPVIDQEQAVEISRMRRG